jgi:hypothetical protein
MIKLRSDAPVGAREAGGTALMYCVLYNDGRAVAASLV